jgi:hypothetical protein
LSRGGKEKKDKRIENGEWMEEKLLVRSDEGLVDI